jgi:solute carrier family 24 (sodium/potassium/calcium exchanger), member 4
MAISNSIGSNVFDILICLGLPWFIQTVIINTNETVRIFSKGIFYSSAILMSTVLMLIISFILNKWKLNKKLGISSSKYLDKIIKLIIIIIIII